MHIIGIGNMWKRLRRTTGRNEYFNLENSLTGLDILGPKFSFLGGYDKVYVLCHSFFASVFHFVILLLKIV